MIELSRNAVLCPVQTLHRKELAGLSKEIGRSLPLLRFKKNRKAYVSPCCFALLQSGELEGLIVTSLFTQEEGYYVGGVISAFFLTKKGERYTKKIISNITEKAKELNLDFLVLPKGISTSKTLGFIQLEEASLLGYNGHKLKRGSMILPITKDLSRLCLGLENVKFTIKVAN